MRFIIFNIKLSYNAHRYKNMSEMGIPPQKKSSIEMVGVKAPALPRRPGNPCDVIIESIYGHNIFHIPLLKYIPYSDEFYMHFSHFFFVLLTSRIPLDNL